MSAELSLRDQLDEAHERIRQLEELLAPGIQFPLAWRLSRLETRALSALYARKGFITREGMMEICWDNPDRDLGSLNVMISKLRRKLAGTGVEIVNRFGQGYELAPASREILKNIVGR